MRKCKTTRLASLRRPIALLFRLSLVTAIWHAPLPTIHTHAEAGDHDAVADDSSHASKFVVEFILPCQLNGCEGSSHSHGDNSEDDHSTHIAAVGYGLFGDADVELIESGTVVDQLVPMASADIQVSSVSDVNLFESAHQIAGTSVPSLPLRANLQVFRI